MPFLGVQPNDTFASVAKQTLTGDILGTTVFTLDHGVSSANDIALYINSVRQEPVTAYNASGNTLTLTESINAADDAYLIYIARTFQSLSMRGITDNTEDAIMTIDGSLTTGGDAVLNVGQNQASGYYVQDKTFGFEISNGGVGGNTAQIKNAGNVILSHNQIQDNLTLRTNNTDRVTILSGGNVGIGKTPSSSYALDVNGNVYAGTYTIPNGSSYKALQNDGTEDNVIYYSTLDQLFVGRDNTHVKLRTDGQIRLTIDSDGIKFNNDTAAANALDDYEEGNWLPTPKDLSDNAATFTTRVGYYVKIGRLVYVTVDLVNINTTGCTSTDAVLIKGLPFTPVTGAGNTYHTGIAAVGGGVAGSENVIGVRVSENVDYIVMAKGSQSLMGDLVKFQDVSSGSADIRFSLSYYTSA